MRFNKTRFVAWLMAVCMFMTMAGTYASAEEAQSGFAATIEAKFNDELSTTNAPKMRWWLAEASHTDETLENAVQEIYDMGFGGLEILTLTESSLDVTEYGWGTEEWYHDTLVVMQKATELGMSVAFTSGSNWQPVVPGINVNDEAVNQELDFSSLVLSAGEAYDGAFEPHDLGEGYENVEQKLVRVVAARLVNEEDAGTVDLNSRTTAGFMTVEPFETVYLAQDSVQDITDCVSESDDGLTLNWTAPDDGSYVVFGFWRHATAQSASATNETSYVVNHVDRAGAEALMELWDNYMFTDEMLALIAENGNVDFFMDSLETQTTQCSDLYWSADFLDEFEARRGYDLTPYLPIIIQYDINFLTLWVNYQAYTPRFDFDTDESIRQKVVNDVYMTQTELYEEEYLTPIREWLNEKGIKLRAQASYGFPTVEYEISIPLRSVDTPETETLEMANTIDLYKTQSGAVHLYDKGIFSCETGALNGGTYSVTLQEYMQMIFKAYAGGVNSINLHGYASETGPEEATEWPGYEGIGFTTSERWGLRNPYGKDITELTTYLTRLQTALRSGRQLMDVGILNTTYTLKNMDFWYCQHADDYEECMDEVTFWDDETLGQAGYTYEYFSGEFLSDDSIVYEDGLYDADGVSYQALVLYQDSITVEYAENLLKLAEQGMPVVVVEGAAATSNNYFDDDDAKLAEIVEKLCALPNVKCIADESEAAAALAEMGILPRVSYGESSDLLTLLRHDTDADYVYAYNPTEEDISIELSFDGLVTPYTLDCWTGDVDTVAQYRYEDGRTIFTASVKAGDMAMFTLDPQVAEDAVYAISTDADGIIAEDGKLYAVATTSGSYTAQLSDGETAAVEANVNEAQFSGKWALTVEDWQAGEKHTVTEERNGLSTTEVCYDTAKSEISVELDELKTWGEIAEIGDAVSGIGTYTTSFTVADDWSEGDGLLLDLGDIDQTVTVYVNGTKTQAINLNNAVVDISDLVQPGENSLEIQLTTTLNNRLIAMGRLEVGSTIQPFDAVEIDAYGLTDVSLIPYKTVEIR